MKDGGELEVLVLTGPYVSQLARERSYLAILIVSERQIFLSAGFLGFVPSNQPSATLMINLTWVQW